MLRRAALTGLAILWIACLIFVTVYRFAPQTPHGSIAHRSEHVVAFGILGLMLLPLARSNALKWWIALAMLVFAGALELGQHKIFGQTFEWWDVRDDGIGILAALLLLRLTRIRALLVREP